MKFQEDLILQVDKQSRKFQKKAKLSTMGIVAEKHLLQITSSHFSTCTYMSYTVYGDTNEGKKI